MGIFRKKRSFENDYNWFTAEFLKKGCHLKYFSVVFSERAINSELHAIVVRYPETCSLLPVKLATGRFHMASHNYTNPGYGLSLVDTLGNAGSYR